MENDRRIFWDDLRPLKLVSIPLYFLAALGLLIRHLTDKDPFDYDDLHFIFSLAPWWMWALTCAYVAVSRVVGIAVWRGNLWTKISTPVVGISMWSMLFAASVAGPDFGMGLLYLVSIAIEAWILAQLIADRRE